MNDNKQFLDTYKKYINKGWYSESISTARLDNWTSNFPNNNINGFNPILCAKFLLDSLIYYQEKHTRAIITSIESKILSSFNQRLHLIKGRRIEEDELKRLWISYKDQCLFIAAADSGLTGDSAHQISRLWRNTTTMSVVGIERIEDEISNNGKRHIFFVDDFIGTGSKMIKFLSEPLYLKIAGEDSISKFIDSHPMCDFNIAVIAIHQAGLKKISSAFPNLELFYGDYYDSEYDLISDECILYDLFGEDKNSIISYLSTKQNELDYNNPYSLNLPIAFQHGCPNNSLSLYHSEESNWKKLLDKSNPR